MFTFRTSPRLLALAASSLALLWPSFSAQGAERACPKQSPDAMVSHGQALIQAYCLECMDSSKEKLEEGITCVQQALARGFGDEAGAHKLLAKGAVGMYSYSREPEEKRREQLEAAARLAFEKAPTDPEVMELYATWTTSRQVREQLQQQLTVARGTPRDHYRFALSLIAGGRIHEAIEPLRRGLPALRDPAAVRSLVDLSVDSMKQAGCAIDKPAAWASEAREIEMAALRSTSDAETKPREQQLARFVARFLKAIEQAGCQE